MQSSRFFFLLCLLSLIDSTNYAFFIPIIPDFLIYQGISLSIIGVILSFFQIGSLITSIYLSKFLLFHSKKSLLIVGQTLLILSNFGFAAMSFELSTGLIIFIVLTLRFYWWVVIWIFNFFLVFHLIVHYLYHCSSYVIPNNY